MSAWDSPENAEAYARFSREFPLYRDTSAVLADAAGLETARLAVDLACGTGVTTEAILVRLPPAARVVALDRSAAMLAVARELVTGPRVRWVNAPAEDLPGHVERSADAVVCNSAFWQMDMPAVAAAVARVLRPEGRFVCNIPEGFLRLPADGQPRSSPGLGELMWAAAVLYHGFVPRPPDYLRGGGLPRTVESVTGLLEAAGLQVEEARIVEHVSSPESMRAWLSIPLFTDRQFPGLSYEQRMDALAVAYDRLDRSSPQRSRWVVFVAGARGS